MVMNITNIPSELNPFEQCAGAYVVRHNLHFLSLLTDHHNLHLVVPEPLRPYIQQLQSLLISTTDDSLLMLIDIGSVVVLAI